MKPKFQKSPHVIPFSIGLRDCPGKRLAKLEVFDFATKMVDAFKITTDKKIEIKEHWSFLLPEKLKLKFERRT